MKFGMRGKLASAGVVLTLSLTALAVTGAPTSAASSKEPLKVALMGIYSGANYVPGADNAFKLAVKQINKSGGILGRPIEFKTFDTDITPQGAATATSLALQYHPDLVTGYGISAGLKASAAQLNAAKVLVIHSTLDPKLTSPSALGGDLYFRLGPTVSQYAGAADRFLFNDQKVKKMMVINTQDSAPTDGGATIIDQAKTANVQTDHRAISPVATDVTEPILAANSMNADAIWEWGYATTDALTVKTAAANGFKGPIMTFSAGSAASAGLIPQSLLTDKVYSLQSSCGPTLLTTPAATSYVAAYKKAFGGPPAASVGSAGYDALYLWQAAAEKAKSVDATKVAAAMKKISHDGVCGTEKADANNNLIHSITIAHYPNGVAALAKQETNVTSPN